MDGYVVLCVLALLVSSRVDGRSWRYNFPKRSSYGDRIVFEDDDIRWWQNYGESTEEWEPSSGNHEPSNKQLRNWDSDRVWFPDFSEKDFPIKTSPTESMEVTISPFSRNVDECIKQCPTTPEYNPVCGTNGATYSNVGHLECARLCGVDVRIFRHMPCSSMSQETSPTESTESSENEQRRCIETCPATPEYNPICGTNNVTYQNRGRLECARFCGIDVEVKRLSPCHSTVISDQAQRISASKLFISSTAAPDKPNFSLPKEIIDEIFNKPVEYSNVENIDVRQGE